MQQVIFSIKTADSFCLSEIMSMLHVVILYQACKHFAELSQQTFLKSNCD